jgi:hypothetical protein
LYGDKYLQQIATPRFPTEDHFQEEYNRLTQVFYAISNIKTGTTDNKNQHQSGLKEMYFNCGLETPADNISASWNPNSFVGASEETYTYQSTKRSTSLSLVMFADIKDARNAVQGFNSISDIKSYKAKIEWLMQHCYPSYHANGQIAKAPLIYLTLGNLFVNQPCIIDSVVVTYHDVWEIDEENVIPIIADVELGLTIIHRSSPTNSTGFLTDNSNL